MADVQYEFYNTQASSFGETVSASGQDSGVTFTAASTHDVSFFLIPLALLSGTGDMTYGLYATAAGIPTGAALASGSIDITTIAGSETMTKLQLDTKYEVQNTLMYAICLFGTGLSAGSVTCYLQFNGPKFSGTQVKRAAQGVDPWTIPNAAYYLRYEVWDGDLPAAGPTPDPATFSVSPTALEGGTSITMTATTGATGDPPVSYKFVESSGNPGGANRDWDTDSSYTNTGLTQLTQYTYTVQMRDANLVEGAASGAESATTLRSSVALTPYNTNKRLVMVGNNVVWYEDI